MNFSEEFGLKKRCSFDEATHWSKTLDHAVTRWAPPISSEDAAFSPDWIGTAVASTVRSPSRKDDQWTAVVVMETTAPLRLKTYRRFWRNADHYMRARGGSFAALVVGPVKIAAGVSVGGSVGVPGGSGGTLGGTIEAGKSCIALTAGHVVSSGEKDGVAEQPADGLGNPQTEIGRVIGWSELRRRNNKADLGLIRLHPQCDDGERNVLSGVGLEGMAGTRVRKTGATTGTTVGDVTLFDADLSVIYADGGRKHFDGLMGIQSGGQDFAALGDSGALVFAEDQATDGDAALGMVIAVASGYKGSEEPVCWTVSSTAMSTTVGSILRDGSRTKA